jgi:hypothetical protein
MDRQAALKTLRKGLVDGASNKAGEEVAEAAIYLLEDLFYQIGTAAMALERIALSLEQIQGSR